MKKKYYFVYILEMQNGYYYTGYTNDLDQRSNKHFQGKEAKFTKAFKPKRLVQAWRLSEDKGTTLKVEAFIKRQKREVKEEIVQDPVKLKKMIKKELKLRLKIKPVGG